MKRKLALLLSAVMVMGSLPMTAFAATTNSVSRIVTGTDGTIYTASSAPYLEMKEKNLIGATKAIFKLTLTNGEWSGTESAIENAIEVLDVSDNDLTKTGLTPTVDPVALQGKVGTENIGVLKGVSTLDSTAETTAPNAAVVKHANGDGVATDDDVEFVLSSNTYTLYRDNVDTSILYGFKSPDYFKVTALLTANMMTTETTNNGTATVDVTKLSDSQIIIEIDNTGSSVNMVAIRVPLMSKITGSGDATVTIDPMSSVLTGASYKYANVVGEDTTTTIQKANDLQEGGSEIKPIVITEVSAGSMKDGAFQIKLSNGFEFVKASVEDCVPVVHPSTQASVSLYPSSDGAILYGVIDFNATATATKSTEAVTISLPGLKVKFDSDDVSAGDICEATISGISSFKYLDGTSYSAGSCGIAKQTLSVGIARDYSVNWTAENKTLPTFYSGRADKDEETLEITLKEVIASSWIDSRKTEITFPAGVKVLEVDASATNYNLDTPDISHKAETSVITLTGDRTGRSGKAEIDFTFTLSISPEFTGDIVATLGGSAIEDDMDVTVGKAVFPFTVEAETNEVSIDYRNVSIKDIIITEVDTGLLEKDEELILDLEYIGFDGTPTVEIVEGDIKLGKISTGSGSQAGELIIKINTATQKTPAVLKITDAQLYLERSLPAGSYALDLKGSTFIQNYYEDMDTTPLSATTAKNTEGFDVDSVTVLEDLVEVVTAGRDQDDSTFTTTISVTIGADKLTAGKTEIALDVPAYISEGYTMLPVRAVTEALSGAAIVRWDDTTKTVTITFGSRVISMTVGSKTMNINGVGVQMSKACEITNSRAFLPLRDLGYALGLNDSKINWNDATKTATLN